MMHDGGVQVEFKGLGDRALEIWEIADQKRVGVQYKFVQFAAYHSLLVLGGLASCQDVQMK
jgi:hypothetical protein